MRSFLLRNFAGLLTVAALVIALGLLVKGHEAPGGGFVAGLAGALVTVLLVAAIGAPRLQSALPVAPLNVLLAGLAILLLCAVVPVFYGDPPLTQASGHLSLPFGLGWKWHTALVFDLGVALAVAGGLSAAGLLLWTRLALEAGLEP